MKIWMLAAALLFQGVALHASEPTLIYLVRHAEKVDESRDPDLNKTGHERAEALAQFLSKVPIDAFFATQYKRTSQTIAPLAEQKGVKIQQYEAGESGAFVSQFKKAGGGTLVIAGHSNTVPEMVEALGGGKVHIEHSDYDNLYLVIITDKGSTLQHFRFVP